MKNNPFRYLRIFRLFKRKYYIFQNKLLLFLNNVTFGENLIMYNRIYFRKKKKSEFNIGKNFIFKSHAYENPLCCNITGAIFIEENAKLIIGDNVGMSSPHIWCKNKITIGNNVLIGANCIIMDNDAHSLNYKIRSREINENGKSLDHELCGCKEIFIKDNVFIGMNSIILKGVSIGERSIIAAGSVVTKSIPSDCIAGGNPCKVIKLL